MRLALLPRQGVRALAAAGLVLATTLGLTACERLAGIVAPEVPPPRSFMRGGVWYPAATGYWFHQYAEIEELSVFLSGLDFACTTVPPTEGKAGIGRLRCERSFRLPGGILSRTDVAEFSFRRNGAVVSAESGCRYALFDAHAASGTCQSFAAPGAVFFAGLVFFGTADGILGLTSLGGAQGSHPTFHLGVGNTCGALGRIAKASRRHRRARARGAWLGNCRHHNALALGFDHDAFGPAMAEALLHLSGTGHAPKAKRFLAVCIAHASYVSFKAVSPPSSPPD